MEYQEEVTEVKDLPKDNLEHFSYHIQAMVEELGEVMKADKRWKTHRNSSYNSAEKLEEIADVFITAMNIAIHSGYTSDEVLKEISDKINKNYKILGAEE
jgi:NTP pyrophosphatase (non-canonical NTP hydrolase)